MRADVEQHGCLGSGSASANPSLPLQRAAVANWRRCTSIHFRILPTSNAHSPLNILATRPQTRKHHGGSPDREAGGGGIPAGGTQRRSSPVDRGTRPVRRRVGAGPGDLGLRRSRRQRPREGIRGGRKDRGGGRRGDAFGGEGVLGWKGPSYQDQANTGESQQRSYTVHALRIHLSLI
jgi:hypothetical protein